MYRPGGIKQRASRLQARITHNPTLFDKIRNIGIGSELKALFGSLEIEICSGCEDRSEQWNRRGLVWCRRNEPELVGWLINQADKRKLSIIGIGIELAKKHPVLAARIAFQKAIHPMTASAAVAATELVRHAHEQARMKRISIALPIILGNQ